MLATAHLDGKVRIWKADQMMKLSEFQVHGRFVYGAMSFSPDGLWLATGAQDGSISLWDPASGETVWDVGRHQGYAYTVSFGHDSRTILSGGEEGTCYLWDLRARDKREVTDLDALWQALSNDNALAAYQAMWDLRDSPQQAVPFLAKKLRPIKDMLEPDPPVPPESVEEQYRLRQLKTQLANGDKSVQRAVAVRRAMSVLTDIGTPEALNVLKDIANQNSSSDISRLAARTCKRVKIHTHP
jgi:WD40 repeat protein